MPRTWNAEGEKRGQDGKWTAGGSGTGVERLKKAYAEPPSSDAQGWLKAKYPELEKLSISEDSERLVLHLVVVPKAQRESGIGSRFMSDLVAYADKNKKRVELTPSSDFGGSKSRLVDFYKRYGFVENKGRNKDYAISEAMYRDPQ